MSRVQVPEDGLEVDPIFLPRISSQDVQVNASEKARRLLKSILPERSWLEFEKKGTFKITGRRGIYIISVFQTEIRDLDNKRRLAHACLQLSIPAPTVDRMVAEYLLIKNDEDLYWNEANIFPYSESSLSVATLFFFMFNSILLLNLFTEVLLRYFRSN